MPVAGLPRLLSSGGVLAPSSIPAFFTPGIVQELVPQNQNTIVINQAQPVVLPLPVAAPVVEDAVLAADVLAAERDARVLAPRSPAFYRSRGITEVAPVLVAPTAGIASGKCQAETLQQLRASNVRADDLRFGESSTSSTTRDVAVVRGNGILLDSDSGRWRRFNFDCDYKVATAQARAVVRLQR
jgi:hypothetical protein